MSTLFVLLQEVVKAATDLLPLAKMGASIGAALVTIGAAFGLGNIGRSALESMARQPEVASNMQMSMILASAFVEGVSFFALVVCLLVAL